jgi:hypothetical protein
LRESSLGNAWCSLLVFERNSRLQIIEHDALAFLWGLKCICFPIGVILLSRLSCSESSICLILFGHQSTELAPCLTSIPHFLSCASLSEVTCESGSQLSLGESTFSNCSSLKSIFIPATVQLLGNSCFHNCSSLSEIIIESGSQLSRLGESTFFNCSSLKSIFIPATVQLLDYSCFDHCSSLSAITYESSNPPAILSRLPSHFAIFSHLLKPLSDIDSDES